MLIVTWNVNSLKARLPYVLDWLNTVEPDVLCMQETKMAQAQFPALEFQRIGYESAHLGQGRWNGVAIVSRVGLQDVHPGFEDDAEPDADARLIWASCEGVRIGSVYVPNGREIGHEQYRYKLEWLGRLRRDLELNYTPDDEILVCGDWNIAPEDLDVWDPSAFVGSTHVTEDERRALSRVKEWGLIDVFRRRYPRGSLFSYWDYRAGDFHKHRGMRIDYILASRPLAERSLSDLVDRNARKNRDGNKPSDHAPVLALFAGD